MYFHAQSDYAVNGAVNARMNRMYKSRGTTGECQSGQAMVEFALVIVFVFLVFLSILQMILLMYAYNTFADAAKEGVRYAIVHGTGLGAANCSGPGTVASITPAVACTDATGANVVSAVIGGSTCAPTCGLASFSFQAISSTNFQCSTPTGNSVNVCYDPGGANSGNSTFGSGCSQPGCLVRVTVRHTYRPFFGFSWPSFMLNAAADGRITN